MKTYTKFRGTLDEEPLQLVEENGDQASTSSSGDEKKYEDGTSRDPLDLDISIKAPSDEKIDHQKTESDESSDSNSEKNGKNKKASKREKKDKSKDTEKSKSFGNRKLINVSMNSKFSLGKSKGSGGKSWVHPPEALLKGHIVYNVKFLGHVEVDQPKGAEVVKDAIRKMKFNKQVKKAEGQKTPKVELTISIDGVTVQEPKYKVVQHRYPLHRISYCADDKGDKRIFSFIAKDADKNVQNCFVFDSEKCAEEITLTIGQAFDLAYKRFLESSSKDIDLKKQYLMAQRKVQQLTQENLTLKARVADLERMIDPHLLHEYDKNQPNGLINNNESKPVEPVVGRKLENLLLDDQPVTQQNGITSQPVPALAPPPPVPARNNITVPAPQAAQGDVDLFGATPFTPTKPVQSPASTNPFASPANTQQDPFGMDDFSSKATQDIDQQIKNVDRELLDLQTGFSQGLSMCADDFSLADLDPLSKK